MKAVSGIMLILLLTGTVTLTFTRRAHTEATYDQAGLETDVLRGMVIRSPDAALLAMQTDVADVSPDQIRTSYIEDLVGDGFTMTSSLGFHMGYIAYNIRRDQSYRRTDLAKGFWPLADVDFRHALIHGFDQLRIVSSIHGYIATPVRSLVPPAQSYWYNPAVPEHPFNLGNPFTSAPGEHSTCGILKGAGYAFVDVDTSGTVTDVDYWNDPNGNPLPKMVIWSPLLVVAPTSYQYAAEFVNDLGTVGLKATPENGWSGMINEGADFNEYLSEVFDYFDFDGFMVFWSLERFPDRLYLFCHSCEWPPWRCYNAPGIDDRELDDFLETIMFMLAPPPGDPDPRRDACFEAQRRLYDPSYDYALAYMMLYSRSYFNAFDQNLRGIVRSHGYGSDNMWTWLNARWAPGTERIEDGKTVINYINGEKPDSFNPCYASTKFEWFYIGKVMDSLMAINPYNHKDIPWIATNWELVETPGARMNITYTLRSDIFWQDGRPYTAHDAAFNLLFIRDWQIPRYSSIWQSQWHRIVDVVVHDDCSFTVICSETSWDFLYDFADVAAILPPQVWDRPWADLQEILDYDPTVAYGTDMAPGYSPGPTPPPTNLFGTGPWVFQFYDTVNLYGDLRRNEAYFMTTTAVDDLLTEMFHEVGDVNRDGTINVLDMTLISFSLGCFEGELGFNLHADVNEDGVVDMMDMATAAHYLGWQKEYP